MTGNGRIIDHNYMVTHHAVMAHVDIGHQKVITANTSLTVILNCAAVNGHPFADNIVVANNQPGRLAFIF